MDPLSHAALGRTLAGLGPERSGRACAVAATLGALAPDLDAVFMPFGWDLYLRAHEIGTHAAIGTLGCALLTAGAVRLFARSTPFTLLAGAAWLGSASHVLLDLLSSARIRLFWPFVDRQVSVPLVAMADPWLAALLLAAVAMTLVGRHRRRLPRMALAACVVFLSAKAVLAVRAVGAYRETAAGASGAIVEARWASLNEWHVFDRAGGRLRQWRATAAPEEARLVLSWPIGVESDRIAASRRYPVVRNFLRAHQLVFAVTSARAEGLQWVLWSDIRFCWNPDDAGAPRVEPIAEADGARLSCALWFGVEFDEGGMARRQIVQIGRFMQARGVDE